MHTTREEFLCTVTYLIKIIKYLSFVSEIASISCAHKNIISTKQTQRIAHVAR